MKYEGRNAVKELLSREGEVDKILVQNSANVKDIVETAKRRGIKVQFVPKTTLDSESITHNHQGIIAYASEFNYSSIDDIVSYAKSKKEPVFVLILDGIEDPHNLGSILRVAECSGVHGVIIPKHRAACVNETVIRVSAGASEHIRVARVTNIHSAIEELKKKGVFIYATEMKGASMYKTNLTGDIGIVIGSEGFGVSSLTKKLADEIVSIPMSGKINSLNASVSAGIIVYEAIRQRMGVK